MTHVNRNVGKPWIWAKCCLLVLIMSLLGLTGCSEDDECPVCPAPPVEDLVFSYISYYDVGNEDLMCAKRIGDSWGISIVKHGGSAGRYSSLAVDSKGNPHICYWNATDEQLEYAVQTDSGWDITIVDSEGNVGHQCSIALDSSGSPHISYLDSPNNRVKYAWKEDDNWHPETIVEGDAPWVGTNHYGDWCVSTSIAVDGSSNPHIVYQTAGGKLGYLAKSASDWSFDLADGSDNLATFASLAFDGQGNLHTSYLQYQPSLLKYAWKADGDWQPEFVDNVWEPPHAWGFPTSIAVDANGNPHISFFTSGENLGYAVKTESGWSFELVDDDGHVGTFCSIALDTRGNPHISYQDYTNRNLKYAMKTDGFWVIETVDPWGVRGEYTSIAIGSQ